MRAITLTVLLAATLAHAQPDTTPHTARLIPVDANITLEVLDYAGTGRPILLIPGLGDTAHVFDHLAPQLAAHFHVYAVTRRGFGASTAPAPTSANYSSTRLGDDLLAIIAALHLDRPILAGHSIAGSELSSVATRHPEKISALIYIDAGYPYALYSLAHGNLVIDALTLNRQLDQLHPGLLNFAAAPATASLLAATTALQRDLQQRAADLPRMSAPHPITDPISIAILDGEQKYTHLDPPVLAIFNVPHEPIHLREMEDQAAAFATQVPQAKILRIANADHYLFRTNEPEVLHAITAFMATLPPAPK